MASGNWGGKREGAGRPPGTASQIATVKQLQKEVDKTIDVFYKDVKRGFIGGVTKIAKFFPKNMELLIARAEKGDIESQKFLAGAFMKFWQPDHAASSAESPLADMLSEIGAEILRQGKRKPVEVIDIEPAVGDYSPDSPEEAQYRADS